MSMTSQQLAEALAAAVPFNATLGIDYVEVGAERTVLRLPDRPELHNHVGGPHAGAMFSLGEAASGGVVIAAFSDLLATATPLAANAEISYKALAKGDVTATATIGRPQDEVRTELEREGKVRFPVNVVIADATRPTAEMTVTWHVRRNA